MRYHLNDNEKKEILDGGYFESMGQLEKMMHDNTNIEIFFLNMVTVCPNCNVKGKCIVTNPNEPNGMRCQACGAIGE